MLGFTHCKHSPVNLKWLPRRAGTATPYQQLRVRRRWRRWRFTVAGMLRGAFDVAGAEPCPQFLRLPRVFVVHDGVEFGHFFVDLPEQLADERRVLHAAVGLGFIAAVRFSKRITISAKVDDEVSAHFV